MSEISEIEIYTSGEERMRRIPEKCRAGFFRYPGWKRISIHQFPVHELAFWGFADDRRANRIPVFHHLEYILNLSWVRPRLINVCFILHLSDIKKEQTLCVNTQDISDPPLRTATRKWTSWPIHPVNVSP